MRVLIALDESEQAEGVLEALAPWLRRSAGDVRLLGVMDASRVHETVRGDQPGFLPTPQGSSLTGVPIDVSQPVRRAAETHGQALSRAHSERERHLQELAHRYLEGISPHVHVLSSEHTAEAIANYAQEIEADLIAVGTHGRSGLSRVLMGSVAEALVRTSPVPVLTVRSGMHTPADREGPHEEAPSATPEPSEGQATSQAGTARAAFPAETEEVQKRLPFAIGLVALGGFFGWLVGRRGR